ARLLSLDGDPALGVLIRDLPPALPRPDPADPGGAAPDPRAAHAALARRVLRPGEGGDGPHQRPGRPVGQAPRLRAARPRHARGDRGDLPKRTARIPDRLPHGHGRARQPDPARLPGGRMRLDGVHTTQYDYDS